MPEELPAHLSSYLVETYWPGVTEPQACAAARRVRTAAEELAGRACEIKYVTSYLIASDEVTFCMFQAPSAELVEQTCRLGEMRFDRIVEILHLESE